MKKLDELLDKAQSLPQEAGCYLMKDKNGRVIYVGKAKRLRSRVTSYFNQSAKGLKTEYMVNHIDTFDFMITRSDAESFVLENNLIKEHSPKYNIRLRDDKSYPYLQVNWNEPFPRLEYVRRPKKGKGKELFGPYPPGSNISMIMRVLSKSFGLRDCSLSEFKSRKTPCLLYQMKQCSAPCVGYRTAADYENDIQTAIGFFQGPIKAKRTINKLEEKMMAYAESEEFEMAGVIRDHIQLLQDFLDKSYDQKVESIQSEKNIDVWSYWNGDEEVDISLYMIRSGLLLGQKNFHFVKGELIEELVDEVLQKIVQYYSDPEEMSPDMVVMDFEEEEIKDVSSALQTFGEMKVLGISKKYFPLIAMCRKHAEESQRVRIANADSVYMGLHKLRELLNMKERPRILECYDVAIWQGQSPTASQVVFEEGKPNKKKYRYYHLETRPEGNNDFAMMREVITRRMDNGDLPDVLVIDGGVAQVNTVTAVLRELQIEMCVVGIAKSRELTRGDFKSVEIDRSEERLIIPGRTNPYILSKCPPLFKIIVSMRDEAHRFSRKLHHKAESKRVLSTWLDEVKGLGDEAKKKILAQLSMSQEELKAYTVNDLMNYFGIKTPHAKALWTHLHEDDVEVED
ncbi:excinuclease ABC subunit UvrC [Peredibacter sp. HCB2-198]|uniref:excinuclease ABC subunit UvrC n=1 Tax=Peredibacter sp. HCB2-198 TaxID=3383025 RepID=UPI0038B4F066